MIYMWKWKGMRGAADKKDMNEVVERRPIC